MSWTERAACRSHDPELFSLPERGFRGRGKQHQADDWWPFARQVCRACPVAVECAADAGDDDHTMRGGLTPDERRELRTRKASA